MNITTILILVNVFAAIAIIALVLMQQSKGDMGSAFGGGGSASMFGSKGSANFLTRCTSTMVVVFFVSSLTLAYIYAKRNAAEQEIVPITVEQSSEVPSIDSVVEAQSSEVPTIDVPTIDAQQADEIIDESDLEEPVAPDAN
ncbi:MAG: preprotein translocase subunit SecG [Arenicella sp.]|nr:preprotein translocase subunit SecG [Arenicella sp.]